MSDVSDDSFQGMLSRENIDSTNRTSLCVGDHIAWKRIYGIWHHAIVSGIEKINLGITTVIHYSSTTLGSADKTFTKAKVVEENIELSKQNGWLFKLNYTKANPVQTVLNAARAAVEIGQTGYNLFWKNCEHFATSCKTGEAISIQSRFLMKKIRQCLVKEAIPSTVKTAMKTLLAESAEKLLNGSNLVGAIALVIVEIVHLVIDIDHLVKQQIEGKISVADYQSELLERIVVFAILILPSIGGSIAGQTFGAFIGTFFCPGVGTFIGGLLGSAIGASLASALALPVATVIARYIGCSVYLSK